MNHSWPWPWPWYHGQCTFPCADTMCLSLFFHILLPGKYRRFPAKQLYSQQSSQPVYSLEVALLLTFFVCQDSPECLFDSVCLPIAVTCYMTSLLSTQIAPPRDYMLCTGMHVCRAHRVLEMPYASSGPLSLPSGCLVPVYGISLEPQAARKSRSTVHHI